MAKLAAKNGKHFSLYEDLSNDLGHVAVAVGALLVVTDDDDNVLDCTTKQPYYSPTIT